jgi:hypothetical protein
MTGLHDWAPATPERVPPIKRGVRSHSKLRLRCRQVPGAYAVDFDAVRFRMELERSREPSIPENKTLPIAF